MACGFGMSLMKNWLFGIVCAGAVLAGQAAFAQSPATFDPAGMGPRKAKSRAPDVKPPPQAWPRLEAGAVICRTEADLDRLAARRRGEGTGGAVDCRILHATTAISIVQRKGSGKTEIRTTDPQAGDSGWTDVWLPEKAPPGSVASR